MQLLAYLVTFIAGVLLTIQVGLNSTLGRAVGNVRFAVLANFLVGSIGLLVYFTAVGGGLGAFYVTVATLVGPRIGAAALLALTVLGQLLASLIVDQFGWLGFPLQPISLTKLAGAALLLGGVGLIVR